jgi:hypothetical protein
MGRHVLVAGGSGSTNDLLGRLFPTLGLLEMIEIVSG